MMQAQQRRKNRSEVPNNNDFEEFDPNKVRRINVDYHQRVDTPGSADSGQRSDSSTSTNKKSKWKKSRKVKERVFKRKPSQSPLRQLENFSKRTASDGFGDYDYPEIKQPVEKRPRPQSAFQTDKLLKKQA